MFVDADRYERSRTNYHDHTIEQVLYSRTVG